MKFPNREDFLDYVEGTPVSDPEVQKNILTALASSQLYREQCAEIQRDLYQVDVQVPEYRVRKEFAVELSDLAQAWLQLSLTRRYSLREFPKTKEFRAVFLILGLAAMLLVGVLLFRRRRG